MLSITVKKIDFPCSRFDFILPATVYSFTYSSIGMTEIFFAYKEIFSALGQACIELFSRFFNLCESYLFLVHDTYNLVQSYLYYY